MKILVMKFGGKSVSSPKKFLRIAEIILKRNEHYPYIVVVVSAMGRTTDQLIELAHKVNPHPPTRELDMLVSVGERVSISLLAMALESFHRNAISFTGSQSGIITCTRHSEARIIDVKPHRIFAQLQKGKIVIVAGFQGVSVEGEITTLGRGGSDTSAVALAVALRAEKVEFYKDVLGVFSDDPKKTADAKIFPFMNYKQALDLMQKGAKVLHPRAVALAAENGIPLQVLSFKGFKKNVVEGMGTLVGEKESFRIEKPVYEKV